MLEQVVEQVAEVKMTPEDWILYDYLVEKENKYILTTDHKKFYVVEYVDSRKHIAGPFASPDEAGLWFIQAYGPVGA